MCFFMCFQHYKVLKIRSTSSLFLWRIISFINKNSQKRRPKQLRLRRLVPNGENDYSWILEDLFNCITPASEVIIIYYFCVRLGALYLALLEVHTGCAYPERNYYHTCNLLTFIEIIQNNMKVLWSWIGFDYSKVNELWYLCYFPAPTKLLFSLSLSKLLYEIMTIE